jgi:molybdenum ABC transporter molybdate-binding protein
MEPMAALTQGQYQRLAIANPKLAPYGKAAVEILSNMDLLQESRAKWVVGENIAQAFQFFSSGNADLGFVANSQIISSTQYSNKKSWAVPETLYTLIKQDAVLLRKAQGNAAALSFYEFLKSKQAQSIIQNYGYDVPPILEGVVK